MWTSGFETKSGARAAPRAAAPEVEVEDEAGVGGGLVDGRAASAAARRALVGAVVPGELDDAASVLEVGVLELLAAAAAARWLRKQRRA